MGVLERRAREKEALTEAILDAASELIAAEGLQNLSIRKLAEKIEYAPSTIYLYFEDKNAILAGICIRFFEDLSEQLQAVVAAAPDPVEALRTGMRCYVNYGLANRTRYQVTFMTQASPELPPDHPICVAIREVALRALSVLGQGIEAVKAVKTLAPEETRIQAFSGWLSLHGLVSGLITSQEHQWKEWPPTEVLINQHIEHILRGLGAV